MAKSRKREPAEHSAPSPAAWGVEIVFFDEFRRSELLGARRITVDHKHVTVDLESGESVAYEFQDVKRVLLMHSTKYQAPNGDQGED